VPQQQKPTQWNLHQSMLELEAENQICYKELTSKQAHSKQTSMKNKLHWFEVCNANTLLWHAFDFLSFGLAKHQVFGLLKCETSSLLLYGRSFGS
jgi:hypothetical protein